MFETCIKPEQAVESHWIAVDDGDDDEVEEEEEDDDSSRISLKATLIESTMIGEEKS